jgi:hypothetical protein
MAATDKRKIGSYTLGRVILRGDRSGRAPAIYEAHDGGIFLFAKIWSRTGSGVDLQALWNHEIARFYDRKLSARCRLLRAHP